LTTPSCRHSAAAAIAASIFLAGNSAHAFGFNPKQTTSDPNKASPAGSFCTNGHCSNPGDDKGKGKNEGPYSQLILPMEGDVASWSPFNILFGIDDAHAARIAVGGTCGGCGNASGGPSARGSGAGPSGRNLTLGTRTGA